MDKAYTVQVLATATHCHKTYVANSTVRIRYFSLQCMYSTRPLFRTGTHGRACISFHHCRSVLLSNACLSYASVMKPFNSAQVAEPKGGGTVHLCQVCIAKSVEI